MRKSKVKKYKIHNYGDEEIEIIAVICAALLEIPHIETRQRILQFINAKFMDAI